MKGKISYFILILTLIFVTNCSCAHSQNAHTIKSAEGMLKEFYTKYITEFYVGAVKLPSIQRKYCTTKLLHYIPKYIEQTDGDPFLKGQDTDTAYLKTLSIKKDNKRKNIYTVSYIDNLNQKVTIHLRVIKERGKFKIDSVW
jgi:hypothetical protein